MLQSTTYLNTVFTLAKTISIKSQTIAVSMNIALTERYLNADNLYESEDKSTWIYYRNLAGLRHQTLDGSYTQSAMKIQLLETNEEVELTHDVLLNNPLTFLEIKKFSRYYKEIVSRYPDQELLLRGIIFPVDMSISTKAEDGSILTYDKDLVEYNEISIMVELEKELKNFIKRWDIPSYIIVDDLYASSLMIAITKFMILKINLLRLAKVGTYEAHSFHVNEFFKSNLGIGEYVNVLSKQTKMWLYKNLTHLSTNTGKEETLESLIDNILIPNSISAKEVKIFQGEPVENIDADHTESSFYKRKENLATEDRDTEVITRTSIDAILFKELDDSEKSLVSYIYSDTGYRRNVVDQIDNTAGLTERTKILLLEKKANKPIDSVSKDIVNLETFWLKNYLSTTSKTIEFKDPNTNIVLSLSPRSALILSVYYLFKMTDNDVNKKVNKLFLTSLIDPTVEVSKIVENIDTLNSEGYDYYTPFIVDVKSNISPITEITSLEETTTFINRQLIANNKTYTYVSSVDDGLQEANVGIIIERLKETKEIELYSGPLNKSISDLFYEEDIIINFTESYDYKEALIELVETVTGVEFISIKEELTEIESFKSIINAFTSYTLQILVNTKKSESVITKNNITTIYDVDAASIVEGGYKCLEDGPEIPYSYGDDSLTAIEMVITPPIEIKDVADSRLQIIASEDVKGTIREITPLFRIVEI